MIPVQSQPAIASLVEWWLPQISAQFGEKLHAVVLYGSVTLGDFCPRWSDVDVCVVLTTPITPEEGAAIGDIHDRMRDRFIESKDAGWQSGQVIEGPYVPLELVADETREAPCYTAYGFGRKWAVGHPISAFDRYLLAHFGQLLAGTPVPFTPPSRQALIAHALEGVDSLRRWNESERSAIWLAGMLHWAARSLIFWRDGKMLSKSAALEYEIARESPYAAAFRLALAIRREGSERAAEHHAELMTHFKQIASGLVNDMARDAETTESIRVKPEAHVVLDRRPHDRGRRTNRRGT